MTKLTPKQTSAVLLLASGKTAREVAKQIGVTPETISHWRRQPSFAACLNRTCWGLLEAGRDRLRGAADQAAQKLVELMDTTESDEVKRKVCLDILEISRLEEPYGWTIRLGNWAN